MFYFARSPLSPPEKVSIIARNRGELASSCDKLNDLAHQQNATRGVKDGEGQQARYYSLELTKSYEEVSRFQAPPLPQFHYR